LIALLVGTMALCVALFLIGVFNFAVEDGARCASVKTRFARMRRQLSLIPKVAISARRRFHPPSHTQRLRAVIRERVDHYSMNVGFKTLVIPISQRPVFPDLCRNSTLASFGFNRSDKSHRWNCCFSLCWSRPFGRAFLFMS